MNPCPVDGTDPTFLRFAQRRRTQFYPKADGEVPRLAGPWSGLDQVPFCAGEICRHHFGESPLSTVPLQEAATFHRLFRITLSGGREVIARFNACGEGEPDHALWLDRWAERTLRRAGLRCLEVYAVDLSRRLCPWDYALLEPARGVPLTRFDGDDNTLRPHLVQLGTLLARVHRIALTGHGLLAVGAEGMQVWGACDRWTDYLNNHLDRHINICWTIGAISAEECTTIRRTFADALPRLPCVAPVLLHGDPGSHNVFVEGSAVALLLDWEDALAGDPAHEAAFWATFHPERRHAAFFEGYFDGRTADEDFMDRFWLYYLRVALAKTVVRHQFGLTDQPGRLPASRRIQRGLEGCRRPGRVAA